MILVADEGVDRGVVERLRQNGHEVVYVAELSPSVPDEAVLQQANARRAILLTADKDFGQLVFAHARQSAGVILIRYPSNNRRGLPIAVMAFIKQSGASLGDRFAVLTCRGEASPADSRPRRRCKGSVRT